MSNIAYVAAGSDSSFIFYFLDEIVSTLGEGTFGKVVQVRDNQRLVRCLLLPISLHYYFLFIIWLYRFEEQYTLLA